MGRGCTARTAVSALGRWCHVAKSTHPGHVGPLGGGTLPGAHSLVSKVLAERTVELIGDAFTYQGRLSKQGLPLNASADFVFTLKDAGKGGGTVGSPLLVGNVSVVEGLFTVDLDFGVAAFNGDERWLEIQVRDPSGFGPFTTLSPRQPVRPAPYALQTRGVFVDEGGKVGIGTTEPAARLDVAGSPGVDGIRFPDGTTQTTALVGGGVPSGYLIASEASLKSPASTGKSSGPYGKRTNGAPMSYSPSGSMTTSSRVGNTSGRWT